MENNDFEFDYQNNNSTNNDNSSVNNEQNDQVKSESNNVEKTNPINENTSNTNTEIPNNNVFSTPNSTNTNSYYDKSNQYYNISQGQNGEYYYSFSNSTSSKPKKKKSKKGWIAILVAVALVIGVVGGVFVGAQFNKKSTPAIESETKKGVDVVDESEKQDNNDEKESSSVIIKRDTDVSKQYNEVTELVEDVASSVVEITTETVTTSQIFGQAIQSGAGSGIIITSDGYIVTCAHVIEGATSITVKLNNGDSYEAKLIGSDSINDTAVIKIEKTGLNSAVVGDSDKLVVGADVIAIGNPLGSLGGTVTKGIVSALNREIKVDGQTFNLIQTDAALNPGNSGGALFNISGELIAMVNSGYSSDGIEGLNFAIPINDVIASAEEIINNGYVTGRPALGIMGVTISSSSDYYQLMNTQYKELLNYVREYGVYFVNYSEGQSGDLEFGDRIIAIDKVELSSISDLSSYLISNYKVGDTVKLTVARITNSKTGKSEYIDVSVTLIENTNQ